jgi:DNA-binding SARP family transcriptional activator
MPNGSPVPPPTDARLTLTTLGAWSLSYAQPGQPVAQAEPPDPMATPQPLLGPGKPLALLAYLAFAPGRTARREHLLDVLWADLEPAAAAHAMRQTIWLIRRRLGHDVLRVAGEVVHLAARIEADRDAFLAAVQVQDLETAVGLYKGEFLPSFAAPGGAEFEKWADLERDRLRALFVHIAQSLARQKLETGHPRDALAFARRARDADRSSEASWRLVLEACASANDPLAAALEADQLERALAAESREAEPATRSALRAVRRAPATGAEEPAARTLVAELVGREREFAQVLAAWTAARKSAGRHLHVSGTAGLGKTRLLRDVLARLRATGARALYVRANPGARNLGYAFASDLAAQLAALPGATGISPACAATLVALNPVLASRFAVAPERSDGDEALRHRSSALLELLTAATAEGPVALLLDDVHWADAMSRRVLRTLLPKLEPVPALVITAARPGTADDLAAPGDTSAALRPLNEGETTTLLASLASIPAEPWWSDFCSALHASCRGVPLLILEMLQLAIERGHLAREESGWKSDDGRALLKLVREGGPLRLRIEQLSRERRWLLLLLAVAGTPLETAALVAASKRKQEEVDEDLNQLEQRGLLARAAGDWEPGHDEVAELAIDLATAEATRAAHAALGRLYFVDAERDPQLLVRAGRHMGLASEPAELGTVVRLWTRHRRRQGDQRSLRRIAGDLVPDLVSRESARELVRRLPLSYRMSGGRPARFVAAAGVLALVATALALPALRPHPRPDAIIVEIVPAEGDSVRTVAFGVRLDELAAGTVVELGSLPRIRAGLPRSMPSPMGNPAPRPGGRSWAYTRVSQDSGGMDVYKIGPDGVEHRLTATPGDDAYPTWAPDGSRIAFNSDRWSPLGHSAVAIMDSDGSHVRRLTTGDARNTLPAWSPDGTRIAFVRRYYTAARPDVCWTTTDGAVTRCLPVPGALSIVGWRDARQLIVDRVDSTGAHAQLALDAVTGRQTVISRGDLSSVSADGLWLLVRTAAPELPPHYRLVPLDRPDLARPVVVDSAARNALLVVVMPAATRRYLDSLWVVGPPSGEIPTEGTFRLVARGMDARGQAVTPAIVTWTSGDTAVATVDSSGTVQPGRAGEVTITASGGGWRVATTRLRLRAVADSTVLREAWGHALDTGWVPFGDPRPMLVAGPGGVPSLWQHGDSSFASGVYSRRGFDPSRGLGIEVRLSTPIARPTWQNVTLALFAVTDSVALASWDHVHGWVSSGTLSGYRWCSATLPADEGAGWMDYLGVNLAQLTSPVQVAAALRSGRWWTLRLQIFPDGRCGAAINGRPVWRSRSMMPLDQPLRILMDGYSYHTHILAGPLEVWEGVRGGVDWEELSGGDGGRDRAGGRRR